MLQRADLILSLRARKKYGCATCRSPMGCRRPSEISLETAAREAVTDNAFPACSERWSVTAHLAKASQVIVSRGFGSVARSVVQPTVAGESVLFWQRKGAERFQDVTARERLREFVRTSAGFCQQQAAVGGEVPMIETVERCAARGTITSIAGVLNGTCNFVLERCGEG
jgi:hypothetical protein